MAKNNKKSEIATTKKVAPKFSYKISEKSVKMGDKNVYVLNLLSSMNKIDTKKTLEKDYKVTVLGIRTVNMKKKEIFSRGRFGTKGGGKKVYVTLKQGDSIVL